MVGESDETIDLRSRRALIGAGGVTALAAIAALARTQPVNVAPTYVTLPSVGTPDELLGFSHIGFTTLSGAIDVSLQAAINTAAPGSTIFVPSGTYSVSTMITIPESAKGIRLISGGARITQTTPLMNLFYVLADDVTIQGFTLIAHRTGNISKLPDSYGSPIVYRQVHGGLISQNTISRGGAVEGSTDATGAGIWLTGCVGVTVSDNHIFDCFMGVNTDNFYGESGGNLIEGNLVEGDGDKHQTTAGYVLDLQSPGSMAISRGDHVLGNYFLRCGTGVTVDNCVTGAIISGNTITDCTGFGIGVVHQTSGTMISDNEVYKCGTGLSVNSSGGSAPFHTTVANNVFEANGTSGVQLYSSYHTRIIGNTILANGGAGIKAFAGSIAHHVAIIGNQIAKSQDEGILAFDPLDWDISHNSITDSSRRPAGASAAITIKRHSIAPKRLNVSFNKFGTLEAPSAVRSYAAVWINATAEVGTEDISIIGNQFGDIPYSVAALVDVSGVVMSFANSGYYDSGSVYRETPSKISTSLGIGMTSSTGGGVGVIGIANASTIPSSNPNSGGILFTENGALKYRGASGTVTTIAPA